MGKQKKQNFDLTEIIEDSKEKLKEGLAELTIKELQQSLAWRLEEQGKQIIDDFIEKEIKPELVKHLISHKVAILAGLKKGLDDIAEILASRIKEVAAENLSKMGSYKIEQIMKEVF